MPLHEKVLNSIKGKEKDYDVACEGQSFTYGDYPTLAMYMGDRFGGDGGNYKMP